ncbi:hypothetical protein KR054_007888, partial [Drosophila jambulina]
AQESDLEYARQLQAQINDSDLDSSLQFVYPDEEQRESVQKPKPPPEKRKQQDSYNQAALTPANDYLNMTQHLVHPEWELVDPSPDVHSMFQRFDEKFFQKRLGAVVLEWSKRMYSCAGICYQRSNRYVKEVTIRLSEPLLKLRPRKDLVETLLHEMIHAYFFILNVREGNGGHGPNFKQKMNMINKVAGTNITVYHSFHDEVDAYRTHIWRCNGICQNHTPFKGWVKRTSNRAPGPSDQWWEKHQRDCGGTFMKVSEPSKPPKAPKPPKPPKSITNGSKTSKKALPAVADSKSDIRGWFKKPPAKKPATDDAVLPAVVPSKSRNDSPSANNRPLGTPKSKPKVIGANIRGFGDLTRDSDDEEPPAKSSREDAPDVMINLADDDSTDDELPANDHKKNKSKDIDPSSSKAAGEGGDSKKRRRDTSDCEIQHWESIEEVDTVSVNLDRDTDDDDDEQQASRVPPSGRYPMSSQERSQNVKREVLEDESVLFYEDDIVFIDDEYNDDAREEGNEPAINPIGLDGHAKLLTEFRHQNDVVPTCSRRTNDEENDIVSCPICFDQLRRSELSNHLDGCSITVRVAPPSFKRGGWTSAQPEKTSPRGRKRKSASTKETLRTFGYTESEVAALNLSSSSESSVLASEDELTPRQRRQRSLFKATVGCPKCGQELLGHQLEAHRRLCPAKKRK